MSKEIIKICLPSFRGLSYSTQYELNAMIADKRFHWYNSQPDVIRGTYIDQARDRCVVNSQLESPEIPQEITHFLWIDDDISGFNGNMLEVMINTNLPIIGVLYQQKADSSLFAAGNWKNEYLVSPLSNHWLSCLYDSLEIHEIDWTGFGFCLVTANIFRTMPRPWFERPIIRWEDNGKKHLDELGEDVNFCKKAAALGFKTYIYTKRILTHKEQEMKDKNPQQTEQGNPISTPKSKNVFDVQVFNGLLNALSVAQEDLMHACAVITEFKRAAVDALNKQQKRIEELESEKPKV